MLSAALRRTIQGSAFTDAGAIASEITRAVQDALRNRLLPTGGLRGTTEEIGAEVSRVFDRFMPAVSFAARRPIAPGAFWPATVGEKLRKPAPKVDDAASLERLRQRETKGVSARRSKRSAAANGRTLTNGHEAALRTGWAKWYNDGVTEQGLSNSDVVAFAYSAIRDSRTCPICRSYDGIILRKNDPKWDEIGPPNHYRDRCRKIPVTRFEEARLTAHSRIPKVSPDPGFGGAEKVRTPGPAIQGRISSVQEQIRSVKTDADARRVLSEIDRLGGWTKERGLLQNRLERRLSSAGLKWPDRRSRAKRVADLVPRR